MSNAGPQFLVYVAAAGNVFMEEIAGWVAAGLVDEGYDASVVTEGVPRPGSGHVNLVVAPHEYFDLVLTSPADRRSAAACSIPLCTEQPTTPWFDIQAAHIADCPLVLDINGLAVAEHRRYGITASHLPLGYHPSFDAWGGDTSVERPLDVVFLGALTPRREAALAQAARHLQDLNCQLVLFEPLRPARRGDPGFYVGKEKYELLASAKVLVNLHRGDVPYLEWVRVLEAVANGAAVVTEAVADYNPLRPVDHLVPTTAASFGALCGALVHDDDWRNRVCADAYNLVRTQHTMAASLRARLPEILATTNRPAPSAGQAAPKRTWAPRWQDEAPIVLPPSVELVTSRRLLKRVLTNQLHLRRRLEGIEALIRDGSTEADEVTVTPAYEAIVPEVSVVIPTYNYEGYLGGALASVTACYGPPTEIIVVDDHSTDGSVAAAKAFAAAHPHHPIKVVARTVNRGLSASRNFGFSVARADYVFVLDADNELYPAALTKLKAALDNSDAAFAYPIAEIFGDRAGLVSALPWSAERLAQGPYIDAAALIRKSAWQACGGYATRVAELDLGWEDYDLWLRFADAGYHGVLVPEILARYRSHGGSMVNTTNIETDSINDYFRRRYQNLSWPPLPA